MVKTTTLGGTASDVVVSKVAHGLMTMTVCGNVPDEQAFDSIKSGVDVLPPGVKMMLNAGDFYGKDRTLDNIKLVARFFEKYPDYAEKTFLSVKTGGSRMGWTPSVDEYRQYVDRVIEALRGTKRIDLFQLARLDPEVSVEDTVKALASLVREGKFDHIGLSEIRGDTLRRGHAVHPIAVVEIEVSPMSYEDETKKVLAAAAELGVAVAAYSPLGRGLTTGAIRKLDDLPDGHGFRRMSRFQDENLKYNLRLVDALVSMAAKKGCTPAQLSISWVGSLGEKVIPLPGSSRKARTLENLLGGDVELNAADLDEIAQIMGTNPVKGDRYFGPEDPVLTWG